MDLTQALQAAANNQVAASQGQQPPLQQAPQTQRQVDNVRAQLNEHTQQIMAARLRFHNFTGAIYSKMITNDAILEAVLKPLQETGKFDADGWGRVIDFCTVLATQAAAHHAQRVWKMDLNVIFSPLPGEQPAKPPEAPTPTVDPQPETLRPAATDPATDRDNVFDVSAVQLPPEPQDTSVASS